MWITSLPLRECGLKQLAPLRQERPQYVTPLAGVWIETDNTPESKQAKMSLPLRECGLKQVGRREYQWDMPVTPLAGVWIETRNDTG